MIANQLLKEILVEKIGLIKISLREKKLSVQHSPNKSLNNILQKIGEQGCGGSWEKLSWFYIKERDFQQLAKIKAMK